jgi:hypothetical protein
MANYYSVLARGVSRLATNSVREREVMYEYARTVHAAQLGRHDPQLSTPEFVSERIAFEAAVLRLEAEMSSLDEISPATFADHAPLRDANDAPDIASLLREPRMHRSTVMDGRYWDGISAAPCLLRPPEGF